MIVGISLLSNHTPSTSPFQDFRKPSCRDRWFWPRLASPHDTRCACKTGSSHAGVWILLSTPGLEAPGVVDHPGPHLHHPKTDEPLCTDSFLCWRGPLGIACTRWLEDSWSSPDRNSAALPNIASLVQNFNLRPLKMPQTNHNFAEDFHSQQFNLAKSSRLPY